MVTSIVLTGMYNIHMNSNKKIKINDNVLSVEKDIPFIRYRFESYGVEQFEYIKKIMQQFSLSTHLIEIKLDTNTKNTINYINENIPNIAKYIYIDIDDTVVSNASLTSEVENNLIEIKDTKVDRIVFKDKSSSLDTISAKKLIKKYCNMLSKNECLFGICSSPLSFGELACLTAVKARELMSIYSSISDMALPSANHQCMNCCGCIRYMVVSSDTEAPSDGKVKGSSKTKSNSSNEKVSKPKINKQPISFGMNNL